MARRGEPADLDVLDATGADDGVTGPGQPPSPPSGPGRRRTWPWVAAAIVVVGAVVAYPVRIRLADAALGRLDRRWQEATALVVRRDSLVERLAAAATPDDQSAEAASRRVDAELAGRLEPIRRAIAGERNLDPGVHRLVAVEREALSRAQTGLRTHRYSGLDPDHRVDRVLAEQRSRLHRSAARSPSTRPLTAADATLAALARWSDDPIGSVLAVPFNGNLELLDVDHSSVSVPRGMPATDAVIGRAGYLVAFGGRAGGAVWSITTDGTSLGSTRQLGVADNVFVGLRPDAVWLVTETFAANRTDVVRWVAVEVDGSGRELARAEGTPTPSAPPIPTRELPVAETTAGLLLFRAEGDAPPTFRTRKPDGSETPDFRTDGLVAEPGPTALAWIDDGTPDHVLVIHSATDGSQRTVPNPSGWRAGQLGAFSPDGSRFAAVYEPASGGTGADTAQLGLVDVGTSTLTLVPWPGPDTVNAVAWSADGRRIFLATNGAHPLATFRIGDDRVRTLRARDLNVRDLAILQPAG